MNENQKAINPLPVEQFVMSVLPIMPFECEPWIMEKHYARRMPSIMFSFGLYLDRQLIGIITYGNCANNNLNTIAGVRSMELNRLCINDDAPKNSASFLIGNSLKQLPKPYAVVSYADEGQGHIGYVYQATNWIYTGMGSGDTEFIKDGRTWHRKALFSRHGTGSQSVLADLGYEPIKVKAKHRYLFFCGTGKMKRDMLKKLEWPILPYPKGDSKRYDAGGTVETQGILFAT